MKKEYVKPYLAVESFQLDASVAGGCATKLGHDEKGCTFLTARDQGVYLDIQFGPACGEIGGIDMLQENPDICYHGPVSTFGLLGS